MTSTHPELFDRYSTLFTPATPRGSPVSGLTPPPTTAAYSRQRSAHDGSSLVPVSNAEDPLAILSPGPSYPAFRDAPFKSDQPSGGRPGSNPTLNYFERFGQDAKAAVDHRRSSTLEELLAHQDDPLYWVKREDTQATQQPAATKDEGGDLLDLSTSAEEVHAPAPGPSFDPNPDDSNNPSIHPQSLIFDEDYFTPTSLPSSARASPDIRRSPLRSTSVLIPTPAPPVESTSPATGIESFSHPLHSHALPPPSSQTQTHQEPPRRSSYSTLSSLSSKFMSSLLATPGNLSPPSRPPLDTLLFPPNDEPGSTSSTPSSLHRSRSSDSSTVHTTANQTVRKPTHFASSSELHITHGTPFGKPPPSASLSIFNPARRSPFAAHVYVPPTGAPGYRGEGYDWDRGFSAELDREVGEDKDEDGGEDKDNKARGKDVKKGAGGERSSRSRAGTGNGNGDAKTTTTKILPPAGGSGSGGNGAAGVVKVIDRKAAKVELLARRESTMPVLDEILAELIRAQLPALARLPTKWTLTYSLDQHGISIKTLYSKCEAAMQPFRPGGPTPSGELVVVRDEDGGTFGVWIGKEGVKMTRGSYHGSGESFLWRYVNEKLQVYSWTGRNDYVALCEPGFLSFGGGDGNYGLYLDDSLIEGSSAYCPTFANDPLCSPGPKNAGVVKFECVGLEVWAVGP